LCCRAGSPRLLQAIARDDIIPFLSIFKATNAKNEPIRALILTFFIAEIGILIANIEAVAPLIDVWVFALCCCSYAILSKFWYLKADNLTCTLYNTVSMLCGFVVLNACAPS